MSVGTSSAPASMEKNASSVEEQSRRIMDGYLRALLARGDFAAFFADDVVWMTMETGDRVTGRAAVAGLITALHTQMFDARPEVRSVVVSERTAYLEARFVGIHTGDFFGIAPTGIGVDLPYTVAYEFAEGSITTLRAYFSIAALISAVTVRNAVKVGPTSGSTITGFSHAALTVTNLERSREWYIRVLGLSPVMSGDDGQHRSQLLVHPESGTLVGLHEYADNPGGAFTERRNGLDHLSFTVPGREALVDQVRVFDEHGDVAHSGISDEPYGSVLVFRDPDNIQLELAYLPAFTTT